MEYYEREFFLARIEAGYIKLNIGGEKVKFTKPSLDISYDACELYNDILNKCYNEGCLDDDDLFGYLILYNYWNYDLEEELLKLPENIKDLKVELYEAKFDGEKRGRIRRELNLKKERLSYLHDKKSAWDYVSAKGIATFYKWTFLAENCCDKKVDVINLLSSYQKTALTETDIREMAREEPWSTTWSIKKKTGVFFPEPMTPDQRNLMIWSILYDNVHESPDCPSDDIIEDDDMLDGWFIVQKRKRDKEKGKKAGNEIIARNSKLGKCDEIFLVAKTPEDIKRIHDMNGQAEKSIVKNRFAQMENKELKYNSFRDVRIRNMNKVNKIKSRGK